MDQLFDRYVETMKHEAPIGARDRLPSSLLIEERAPYSIYYAPFSYVNSSASVVLVGITPGLQQARNALNAAANALRSGTSYDEAARIAKETASFSGAMRGALIDMLDYVGLQRKLGLASCKELFGTQSCLVHYTSVLRYPVFKNSKDFSGSKNFLRVPVLREQFDAYFSKEAGQLEQAWFVPLGDTAKVGMAELVRLGVVDESRILDGLQHPSGANNERIAVFLGRKPASEASNRCNPGKIFAGRDHMIRKLASV